MNDRDQHKAPLRLAIIEDEPLAAERLRGLLTDYPGAAIEVVGETDSVAEAIEEIRGWKADLLLCDIRLADGLSFNIWQHVEVTCPTIFTTAYEEYALRAFKVNSVDYLLKPVSAEELYAALDRFRAFRQNPTPAINVTAELVAQLAASMKKPNHRERLMSKVGDRLVPIRVDEVAFFESIDRISWAYTAEGKRHAVGETLDQLEEVLDPSQFKRLNRAVIASAGAVEQMMPYSNSRYRAHLTGHNGEPVIVARERVGGIKEWLGG